MKAPTVTVSFLPDIQRVEVRRGRRLLPIIVESGRPIGYSCRGRGICNACAIWVEGDAGPISEREQSLLNTLDADVADRQGFTRRIACLAIAYDHVSVTTDYW